MTPRLLRRRPRAHGFTLTELAIVVMVIGLLLSTMMMAVSAQNDARQAGETQRTLENAREALIGFALKFGRLPCPATGGTSGVEARRDAANAFTCSVCAITDPYCDGFLPALDLGIGPTDPNGYLVDAWGNRIRYAVSNWSQSGVVVLQCPPNATPPDFKKCPAFTTANAIPALTLAALPSTYGGLARVCDTASCSGSVIATPAVMWSPGKNYQPSLPGGPVGADEVENNAGTPGQFVMHELRPDGGTGGEFDDIVVWLSPNILYSRLVAAGAI